MMRDATYSTEETENSSKCSVSIKCTVPVNTEYASDFCAQIDYSAIRDEIANFVSKTLSEYGINKQNIESWYIGEMVKNSCDSFVSDKSIKIGTNLEILVNIQGMSDAVIVKFKDNGKGLNMSGTFFDVSSIVKQSHSSKSYRYFGGNHLGLTQMDTAIKQQGGTMELKKRKNGGCAVYVTFFNDNEANNTIASNQVDANASNPIKIPSSI